MKTKPNQRLGSLTKDDINFPKHLTPEVVHAALYIHNAKDKEETHQRVEHCAKLIGDELMSYAMSLLVLPYLMDMTKNSPEYNEWLENKHKRLN
jgi:hypothetical protein